MTKRCPDCGETKSTTEFGSDRTRGDGLYAYCKICRGVRDKVNGKKYRQTKKGMQVHRAAQLKHKYGITLEDYDAMFEWQQGACAICGGPQLGKPGKYFDVDHNHVTGEVRGLLCRTCNRMLGLVKEDTTVLMRMINYLNEQHKGA